MKKKKKATKGQRVIGRPFKKGQSGNPKGMKPRPKEHLALMGIEKFRLQQIYSKLAHCTEAELEANENNPKLDIKTKIVSGILLRSKDRDYHAWESFLNRIFGKPKESVSHDIQGKLSLIEIVKGIEDE